MLELAATAALLTRLLSLRRRAAAEEAGARALRRPRRPGRIPSRQSLVSASRGALVSSRAARSAADRGPSRGRGHRSLSAGQPSLHGVIPKDYAKLGLDKTRLGRLANLIGNDGLADNAHGLKVLERVYE